MGVCRTVGPKKVAGIEDALQNRSAGLSANGPRIQAATTCHGTRDETDGRDDRDHGTSTAMEMAALMTAMMTEMMKSGEEGGEGRTA